MTIANKVSKYQLINTINSITFLYTNNQNKLINKRYALNSKCKLF